MMNANQDDTLSFQAADGSPTNPMPNMPGYHILGELGRGGMGVVYRARQERTDREVALKMVLQADCAGAMSLERFRVEGQAITRLNHPAIVTVYEVGDWNQIPYLSMELCLGGSLSTLLQGPRFLPREAAELMLKVTRGVAACHALGIVHRDLKPGNILLTQQGEPKVSDFGLAKWVNRAGPVRELTATGAVLGTPSYMAPEQALGGKDIGPATDVYALGTILYELLTGAPPFRGDTATDVILLLLSEDPVQPRDIDRSIPHPLQSIVMRCLQKNAAKRYANAEELADDLNRYLNGEPLLASNTGIIDRMSDALDRVQLSERFAAYGLLMYWFAVLMLLAELWVQGIVLTNRWNDTVVPMRFVQGVIFFGLILVYRKGRLLPQGMMERQLWCIMGGYFASCFVFGLTGNYLVGMELDKVLNFYPGLACITAVTFFALGSTFWGYCVVIGGGFLLLAIVSAVWQPYAPLLFGLSWFAVLGLLGRRLQQLAHRKSHPSSQSATH